MISIIAGTLQVVGQGVGNNSAKKEVFKHPPFFFHMACNYQ